MADVIVCTRPYPPPSSTSPPLPLADLAAGFIRGNWARGPNVGYPKIENSTDLTLYFLDGPKFTFGKSKIKKWDDFGGGVKDDDPFLFFFWGGRPGSPWIRQ